VETIASSVEYLSHYFPIVIFGVLAAVFGLGTLLISYYVQPHEGNAEKLSTYECGSEPIFLYPWAIDFYRIGLVGLLEMGLFIALFGLAFVYAWRKGALEWE
jgi:NADH-quinone oxidoreductase subunit A